MLKMTGRAAACCALFVLAACGGGGGGGGVEPNTAPAPLTSKADALREFAVALNGSQLPSQFLQVLRPSSAAAAAAKSGGWQVSRGWHGPVGAPVMAKERSSGQCDGGGQYDFEDGVTTHVYRYFGSREASAFRIGRPTRCSVPQDQFDDFSSFHVYDGRHEDGETGTLPDDSAFVYVRGGEAGGYFSFSYQEHNNGKLSYASNNRYRGDVEVRSPPEGGFDIRSVMSYREDETDGYEAAVDLGEAGRPLQILLGESGLVFNGTYAYRSEDCAGGRLTISTPEPIVTNENGTATGGRIRLDSGGASASLLLKPDGSGTLQLPGGESLPVSGAELEQLEQNPC
ncbi:MAG TPA: hypothetical protein VLI06_05940 [Solimonas sp.]|nr:hypothetical protein [Solimonas sp.]